MDYPSPWYSPDTTFPDGYHGPTSSNGIPLTWWDANLSSTMYLFTFLATVVVLAGIAAVLVIRAALSRRRFIAELQAAIERGETLPQYQNPFFASRAPPRPPKDRKPLPPIPKMWEDEMWLKDERTVGGYEDKWEWLVPISVSHVLPLIEAPPPAKPEMPVIPSLGQDFREAFGGMIPRRRQRRRERNRRRSGAQGVAASDVPIVIAPEVAEAPLPGSDVAIGVLIAMPSPDSSPYIWRPIDPEEADVPEVCMGVMECVVDDEQQDTPGSAKADVWGGGAYDSEQHVV